jgi:hypothetical protein
LSCSPAWCSDTEPTDCCNSGAPDATCDRVGPVAAAQHDPVNQPAHYTWLPGGIQVIDITEHFSFLLGNVLKYVMRCDRKGDGLTDLKKARTYLEREIARRERSAQ